MSTPKTPDENLRLIREAWNIRLDQLREALAQLKKLMKTPDDNKKLIQHAKEEVVKISEQIKNQVQNNQLMLGFTLNDDDQSYPLIELIKMGARPELIDAVAHKIPEGMLYVLDLAKYAFSQNVNNWNNVNANLILAAVNHAIARHDNIKHWKKELSILFTAKDKQEQSAMILNKLKIEQESKQGRKEKRRQMLSIDKKILGNYDLLGNVIAAGADINLIKYLMLERQIPLHQGVFSSHHSLLELIVSRGADLEFVKYLIDNKNMRFNAESISGKNYFLEKLIVNGGDFKLVKYLIERHALKVDNFVMDAAIGRLKNNDKEAQKIYDFVKNTFIERDRVEYPRVAALSDVELLKLEPWFFSPPAESMKADEVLPKNVLNDLKGFEINSFIMHPSQHKEPKNSDAVPFSVTIYKHKPRRGFSTENYILENGTVRRIEDANTTSSSRNEWPTLYNFINDELLGRKLTPIIHRSKIPSKGEELLRDHPDQTLFNLKILDALKMIRDSAHEDALRSAEQGLIFSNKNPMQVQPQSKTKQMNLSSEEKKVKEERKVEVPQSKTKPEPPERGGPPKLTRHTSG